MRLRHFVVALIWVAVTEAANAQLVWSIDPYVKGSSAVTVILDLKKVSKDDYLKSASLQLDFVGNNGSLLARQNYQLVEGNGYYGGEVWGVAIEHPYANAVKVRASSGVSYDIAPMGKTDENAPAVSKVAAMAGNTSRPIKVVPLVSREQRCGAYARGAVAAYNQNVARSCGFQHQSPNRWNGTFSMHFNWCMDPTTKPANWAQETQTRNSDLAQRCQ